MSILRPVSTLGRMGAENGVNPLSGSTVPASRKNDAFAGLLETRGTLNKAPQPETFVARQAGMLIDGTTGGSTASGSTTSGNSTGEVRGSLGGKRDTVGEVRQAMSAQNQVLSPESEFALAKAAAGTSGATTQTPSIEKIKASAKPAGVAADNSQTPAVGDGQTPVDRLQHRAMSALSSLAGAAAEPFEKKLNSLNSGLQGILLNGGSLKRARGIELGDRTAGIALDAGQRQTLERAADNRERRADGVGTVSRAARKATRTAHDGAELGRLAARFESGSEGVSAIGYDRVGGTSYGKYQIASRPGSMDSFLNFLDDNDPDMAARLRSSGPTNTGSTKGEMPTVWRNIAAEDPERFEDLQERFIHESHYEPALDAVRRAGYNTREFSTAMKEVLFSTAVQHGPAGATRIFSQAAENVGLTPGQQKQQEKAIISEVYNLRADRFGSSTPQIQAAARERMETEGRMALAMNS